MVSSQELWPPSHEAGRYVQLYIHVELNTRILIECNYEKRIRQEQAVVWKNLYNAKAWYALHPHTVRLLTEGDDTRGCGDTIGPPDDEQRAARNMLRSVM